MNTGIALTDPVHLIVHDNAANMIVGLGYLEVGHKSCFLHTLQLVIDDALFSQRYVKDLITKSQKIVTHFPHSGLACVRLEQTQRILDVNRISSSKMC